jgi:hypothetical protein
MRQGNPLKQIRGTINLVIPTGNGNQKINVISTLGISFEDLNLFTISAYLHICMQLWAPPLLNQFLPKRMLKIRGLFMHAALCEIVVKVWYGFLQIIQRIEGSLHVFDVPIDFV